MSALETESATLTVALVGNPNCGKTTLFNAFTGLHQKIANYPGVTVEKKLGTFMTQHGTEATLIDLPGAYSLQPQSPDEQVTRDVLLGHEEGTARPDRVLCVVDASNLERNLYLATQVLELGLPSVVALNMMDVARANGDDIDLAALSAALGAPVVPCEALTRTGLPELRVALSGKLEPARMTPPPEGEDGIAARYERIGEIVDRCVRKSSTPILSAQERSDRIDAVLIHPLWGWAFFLGLMALLFVSMFSFASFPMDGIKWVFEQAGAKVGPLLPAGDLRSLIVEGIIAGVGSVVVFLPQILILFLFIGLLEDSGYMARAAFLMDRLMGRVGLHGKSFVPLLSCYACAVPGIMATRTIENPNDRLVTILIAPFMSCSARLPVYALMIATLFAGEASALQQGGILLAMYTLGTLTAFAFAWLFKRTLLKAPRSPLILELPPYRRPSLATVVHGLRGRAAAFLKRAGTVIVALSVVLWALAYYPRGGAEMKKEEQLAQSFAGRMGKAIEPALEPIGMNWKMGIGLIGAQAAREVFVSTLAVVYAVGGEDEGGKAEPKSVAQALRQDRWPDGRVVYTPLVCLTVMIFFVLSMQCISTLATMRRETNTWRWPIFAFCYMTGFAYLASLVFYQGGRALGW
ncbi:MAG: ferrous iron transport protein B [Verrucomicrobia bacterium]|nr:ferrous iron transport protein B [Verrucomicrobiota bacterium]